MSQTGLDDEIIAIQIDGVPLKVPEGISVAAAVAGYTDEYYSRIPQKSRKKQGPFCLVGICGNCSMEINGALHKKACMVPVRKNMFIRTLPHIRTVAVTRRRPVHS